MTWTLDRKEAVSMLGKTLPGLLELPNYENSLEIPVYRKIQQIEILHRGNGWINIEGLFLLNNQSQFKEISNVDCTISSTAREDRDPARLFLGDWIHSKRQDNPHWRATFKKAEEVNKIKIENRRDRYSERGALLEIRTVSEDQRTYIYRVNEPLRIIKKISRELSIANQPCKSLGTPIDEIQKTYAQLLKYTLDILTGQNTSLSDPEILRQTLFEKIAQNTHAITNKKSLKTIATITDNLIPAGESDCKSLTSNTHNQNACEELLSISLAHRILNKEHLAIPEITTYEKHLQTNSSLNRVSTFTSRILSQSIGKKTQAIFTKHGLSRSNAKEKQNIYISAINTLAPALKANEIDWCVLYGTLLGFIREGDFLAHDDDVDIALVMQVDSLNPITCQTQYLNIAQILRSQGFECKIETVIHELLKIKIHDVWLDVFPVWTDGQKSRLFMHQMKMATIDGRFFRKLTTIKGPMGKPFPAPDDPEGFLLARYGDNWRTPDPYFEIPWFQSN